MLRCILFILIFLPFSLLCQEIYRSKEIVVTATRTEKESIKAPATSDVVDRVLIEEKPAKTLEDLLEGIPALSIQYGGRGFYSSFNYITLRGFPQQRRTLVTFDGVPLNRPYASGVDNSFLHGISFEAIDRIEVVKGPFSALYGGGAMGGVVSIFTRTPEEKFFSFSQTLGEDGYKGLSFSLGDKWKKLSFLVSYAYREGDGYVTQPALSSSRKKKTGVSYIQAYGWEPYVDAYGRLYYKVGNRGENGARSYSLYMKGFLDLGENSAWLSFFRGKFKYFYKNPESYLRDASGNVIWSGSIDVGSGKYIKVKETLFDPGDGQKENYFASLGVKTKRLKLVLGYQYWPDSWYEYPSGYESSWTDSKMYYGDLQLNLPWKRHNFILGATYKWGWMKSKKYKLKNPSDERSKDRLLYRSEGKSRTFSFYAQDEIKLAKNLTLYVGLRKDWWKSYDGNARQLSKGVWNYFDFPSNSESEISPKVSLVWLLDSSTVFRASWGKAFRPPDLYNLYKTWRSSWGTLYESNPELDPETVYGWEFGFEKRTSFGKARLSYFKNNLYDMIYTVSASRKVKKKENAGSAKINGYEVFVEVRPFRWVGVYGSYTRYIARVTSVGMGSLKGIEGKRLIMVPEEMVSGGVMLNSGGFYLNFTLNHVGKVYGDDKNRDDNEDTFKSYDPYTVCKVKAGYRWKSVELSVMVDNLFDESYYQYYKAPGRRVYGELSFKF